jgi:hypothetical protein
MLSKLESVPTREGKPVNITGPGDQERGPRPDYIAYYIFSASALLLFAIAEINALRLRPSHSATDSQAFRLSVKIFSRFALAGEPENNFSPGSEPALGGPD